MSEQSKPKNAFSSTYHKTEFYVPVTGPVHTGSGDINIQPVETEEQTQSKKEPRFESVMNYLGQSSIGKAIKGSLRFTLQFTFIVGSILFIKWILPANIADTLVGIYLFGLIIWWITKEPD